MIEAVAKLTAVDFHVSIGLLAVAVAMTMRWPTWWGILAGVGLGQFLVALSLR